MPGAPTLDGSFGSIRTIVVGSILFSGSVAPFKSGTEAVGVLNAVEAD